ncbi:hypothetical protein [Mesorhizobium neociceri]|uniref:Uncharacterized protein n=1 Tax=Mesorhizobium neociceri TaxID=1307853 RepID=A0A838BDB5_9HYPH|nr:hypothetical protein [Mesorhizobium neociceri]MBA1144475.1 hypothetical protein [Mesorhizobium neociceri]
MVMFTETKVQQIVESRLLSTDEKIAQLLRRSQERTGQYPVGEFASKHGLSEKSATIILNLHGPSMPACDAATQAFKQALTQREAGGLVNLLTID